ncbi:hypothetical protein JG688_00016250 [Phytophthora aleatoria]|uniref:PiggyBac transposable element-derived protein domain-containing protein n=1 Tax=Phytophthora aleatoria TaxID=2496075 RepID=A0A8J5I4K6_9STRA|nr:hypothetical protein JG688_00016250 [Phytophthora aleatoria]
MDPLWHSRDLLRHIQGTFAEVTVSVGAASPDENTVRTIARSPAQTYLPSKPDKYGIRFYAVVEWERLYVHSVYDNGSGNTQVSPPAELCCSLFPELRRPLARMLAAPTISVKKDSASALWVAMIRHMTQTFEAPTRRCILVCDSYYTRHELAKAVSAFTDDEVRIIGTFMVT